jgi:ribosomal protein L11 methyltransferase
MKSYDQPIHILRLQADPAEAEELAAEIGERWRQHPAVRLTPDGARASLEMYFASVAEAALVQVCLVSCPRVRGAELDRTAPAEWEASFRRQFAAFPVGRRLRICPRWEREKAPRDDRVNLWIDPGLSFGTGQHFTTRFCLEIIDELWLESAFCSFLDVGAGSGLLAIAAARLGCERVVAWEKDVAVISYTQHNLEANQCSNQVELKAMDLRTARSAERFDVVCANLVGGLILECVDRLTSLAVRRLALSGIRLEETPSIVDALQRRGGRLLRESSDQEWSGLLFDVSPAAAGPDRKDAD